MRQGTSCSTRRIFRSMKNTLGIEKKINNQINLDIGYKMKIQLKNEH